MKIISYDLPPKIENIGQYRGIIAGKISVNYKIIYLMMAIHGRSTL
jgi:hypothetical protein